MRTFYETHSLWPVSAFTAISSPRSSRFQNSNLHGCPVAGVDMETMRRDWTCSGNTVGFQHPAPTAGSSPTHELCLLQCMETPLHGGPSWVPPTGSLEANGRAVRGWRRKSLRLFSSTSSPLQWCGPGCPPQVMTALVGGILSRPWERCFPPVSLSPEREESVLLLPPWDCPLPLLGSLNLVTFVNSSFLTFSCGSEHWRNSVFCGNLTRIQDVTFLPDFYFWGLVCG